MRQAGSYQCCSSQQSRLCRFSRRRSRPLHVYGELLEEVISLRLFRWYSATLLRSRFEDDKVTMQVLIQFQNGGHISTAKRVQKEIIIIELLPSVTNYAYAYR